jgi:outer membrane receptor protein involved in Fe transport
VEAEAGLSVTKSLELLLGLQYPEGKTVDDGTYLDDVPARGGFVRLAQRKSRWSWFAHFAFYARDTRPGPTEAVVPGYALLDGGASYRLAPELELAVRARNLLNRAYPGDNEPGAVLAPGRSLLLSLRGTL